MSQRAVRTVMVVVGLVLLSLPPRGGAPRCPGPAQILRTDPKPDRPPEDPGGFPGDARDAILAEKLRPLKQLRSGRV